MRDLIENDRVDGALDLARRAPSEQFRALATVGPLMTRLLARGREADARSFIADSGVEEPEIMLKVCSCLASGERGDETLPSSCNDVGNAAFVSDPQRLSFVDAVDPKLARGARLEGRVIAQALIDEYGRVSEVEVLSCNRPNVGFEEAAMQGNLPVPVYFSVSIDFDLK